MPHSLISGTAQSVSELLPRSSRRRDNVLDALPFVPGGTLLGFYARAWLARNGGTPDPVFREVFQSGRVRFANAYPCLDGRPLWPAPLTLRTCKTHKLHADHTTVDLACTDWAAPPRCDHPDHGTAQALKRVRGWLATDGCIVPGDPPTLVRTRTATSTADDLAEEGALFTRRMLARGMRFHLRVEGPDDLLEKLRPILEHHDEILVGGDRTKEGRLAVEWKPPTPVRLLPVEAGAQHTLTCLSDVILLDGHLRALPVDDPRTLERALGLPELSIGVVASQVRTGTAGGWHALHGMPKPVDLTSAMGSVVTFTVAGNDLTGTPSQRWIGWRRAEGFGHVVVDWADHRGDGWSPRSWSRDQPEPAHRRRHELADKAEKVASSLAAGGHDREYQMTWRVTRSLWRGVEAEVRSGRWPAPPEPESLVPPAHAQSASGHGAGAGRKQRLARLHSVKAFVEACGELGIPTDVASPDASVLAADIGKELDLRLPPKGGRL